MQGNQRVSRANVPPPLLVDPQSVSEDRKRNISLIVDLAIVSRGVFLIPPVAFSTHTRKGALLSTSREKTGDAVDLKKTCKKTIYTVILEYEWNIMVINKN